MRRTSKLIAWVGACLLAAPSLAFAGESVEAQLEELNARMEQMEGQLAEAEAQVAAQEEVIQQSELDGDRQGSNALSAFIESTEISAWVAASYNINFRNPTKSGSGAAAKGTSNWGDFGGLYNLYFPDSNTFQLDQVWIGINKAPTEESRAGFNLDLNGGQAGNGSLIAVDLGNAGDVVDSAKIDGGKATADDPVGKLQAFDSRDDAVALPPGKPDRGGVS